MDTEQRRDGSFLIGCIYDVFLGPKDEGSITYYTDPFAMQRAFYEERYRGYWFIAHNLAFDLAQIFGQCIPAELCMVGSSLYFARLCTGERESSRDSSFTWKEYAHFADTTRHCLKSLASIGEDIGIRKMFENYDKQHPEDLDNSALKMGVSQDAIICGEFARRLQESYILAGTSFRYTVGSSCLELYRRNYMTETIIQMDREDLLAFNEGYYGGRCEAFYLGRLPPGTYYLGDVNSMYPSVMRDLELPVPSRDHVWYEKGCKKWILERPGMSECIVTVPKMMYPPLPWRRPTDGKLLFPVGTFRGYWSHIEIEYALKCGVQIESIIQTWWFDSTCRPFEGYVNDIYAMRRRGGFHSTVGKLLGNNLYGKMGQSNPPGKLVTWDQYLEMITECETAEQEMELNESATVYEKNGEPIAVCLQSEEKVFPKHSNIIWASYITAAARIKLHSFFAEYKALYCDTDSVLTKKPVEKCPDLGALSLQSTHTACEIIGPKSYKFDDKVALKGVPKKSGWQELPGGRGWTEIADIRLAALSGERVAYRAPLRLTESFIREDLPEMVDASGCGVFELIQHAVPATVNYWHPKIKQLSRKSDKRNGTNGWTQALVVGK